MGLGDLVGRILNRDGSTSVNDESLISSFLSNPAFPFLISFPRTGSHWLRMIMELYFEKPSLVRIFYFANAVDFTCYHRHDEELEIERENVLYLYREPVDTIYSQLNYHREDVNSEERIKHWADLYGRHLKKWLLQETFTTKKTVITYEGLKRDMNNEFKKVCSHFSYAFDDRKLADVVQKVSKEEVKKKTGHDKQVVNLSDSYQLQREEFRRLHGDTVLENVSSVDGRLQGLVARPKNA